MKMMKDATPIGSSSWQAEEKLNQTATTSE